MPSFERIRRIALKKNIIICFFQAVALICVVSCTSLEDKGIGIIPMSLAILCIPVFDTLRVMFARLINGGSPFTPDKTHLHHLFIDMGFSHAGTSTIIILIQLIIVLLWYVSYRIGMSISMQFYLVILCGLLICCGYYVLRWHQKHNTTLWQRACQTGSHTHREGKKGWQRIQQIVDTI